jgi:NAD(P)-dependent dehydrogenase (short-subunit alcohol dehydrogenase family)
VTSKSDLAAAAEHVGQKSGYVNLVIANSGITGPTLAGLPKDASLLQFRDHLQNWEVDDINNVFAVNTTAVLSTLIAFLELLDKGNKAGNVEQKSQFVATTSAGAVCRTSLSGYPYNTSKAATVHMMKMLATKLVDFDIRANIIAPGCELSNNHDVSNIATRKQASTPSHFR